MTVDRNDDAAVGWDDGGGGGGGGGGTVDSITPVNQDNVIGRASAGAGPAEEIPFTSAARTFSALPSLPTQKSYLGITNPDATDFKDNVLVATTGNITLSGEQTIDGVLTNASRVLVWQQTSALQNGIFDSNPGLWGRSPDADVSAEVTSGMLVTVDQGTTYADQLFQLITPDPIVLNTTPLTFQSISLPPGLVAYKTVSTAAYTNVLSDTNKRLLFTNVAAKTMTVAPQSTVALAVNTIIELFNGTAAALTVAPGAGVTINAATLTIQQNGGAQLKKRANPNTWDLLVLGGVSLSNTSQWTANQSVLPVTLTPVAGVISTDASLSNVFRSVLVANSTLANPTGLVNGMFLTWLIHNGTGPYTLAYGSKFRWGKGGLGAAPVLSTTASRIHVISAIYDAVSDTIQCAMLDTLPGIAGTKTFERLTPMTSQPPAANFATLDTRNSIALLDFDDTTAEGATWVTVLPEGIVLTSGLIFNLFAMATTAVAGAYVLEVSVERMNTDLDTDSFDTVAVATTTTNATSGIPTKTSITLTTIDSAAAGDLVRVKVRRLPADAADTMVGDLELIAVEPRSAA